jgi:hypothetical protein
MKMAMKMAKNLLSVLSAMAPGGFYGAIWKLKTKERLINPQKEIKWLTKDTLL